MCNFTIVRDLYKLAFKEKPSILLLSYMFVDVDLISIFIIMIKLHVPFASDILLLVIMCLY